MENLQKPKISQINSTTYKHKTEGVIDTIIGDEKQEEFYPRIKFKKWDNECNLSIGLIDIDKSAPEIIANDEIIKWKKKDIEARFYQINIEEGGFEFDVVLAKKPKTNIYNFSLQTKGLTFHKQPKLIKESLRDEQPINCINSYAVYHESKQNNKYKVGKIGHIFRPKIIDNRGRYVWGDMDIKDDILSIIIPQKFIDKAKYPITIDPTFGYTEKGNASQQVFSQPTSWETTGIVMEGAKIVACINQNYATLKSRFNIYLGGGSTTLVPNCETEELTNVTIIKEWASYPFPVTQTFAAQNYKIALWANWVQPGKTTYLVYMYYDILGDAPAARTSYNSSDYDSDTWMTVTSWNTAINRRYSIYVQSPQHFIKLSGLKMSGLKIT